MKYGAVFCLMQGFRNGHCKGHGGQSVDFEQSGADQVRQEILPVEVLQDSPVHRLALNHAVALVKAHEFAGAHPDAVAVGGVNDGKLASLRVP